MATRYNHIQLGVVNANGDVDVLYPQTTAEVVSIRNGNPNVPNDINDLEKLVDSLGQMAFVNKDRMVFLGDEGDDYDGNMVDSEINDDYVSEVYTWSSKKIKESTIQFTNNNKVKLSDLTALPIYPHTFTVDGNLSAFTASCPGKGAWIIEYTPVIITNGVVTTAHQKWTSVSSTNSYTTCCRNYANGSWGSFMDIKGYGTGSGSGSTIN